MNKPKYKIGDVVVIKNAFLNHDRNGFEDVYGGPQIERFIKDNKTATKFSDSDNVDEICNYYQIKITGAIAHVHFNEEVEWHYSFDDRSIKHDWYYDNDGEFTSLNWHESMVYESGIEYKL